MRRIIFMKFRSILLASATILGISSFSLGTDVKAASDLEPQQSVEIYDVVESADVNQQELVETYNIKDYTVKLPTFNTGYQLTSHQPGMTYVTSNSDIKVSSTGSLSTYFSTTAKVYVYRNGVLDHTITVIVGQG